MRKALLAAVVMVLMVAPSYGLVSARLAVDDNILNPSEFTTVHLFVSAVGEPAGGGIQSVAVTVDADVAGAITSTVPVTFLSPFNVTGSLPSIDGAFDNVQVPAVAVPLAPNGGVLAAASVATFPPNLTVGLAGEVEFMNFVVTALPDDNAPVLPVTLNLSIANLTQSGYVGIATWASQVGDPANYAGTQLTIVPEPMSLALLGLGGLLAWRRRR
jgi:hypothetical protein